jgi:hypothetical protein
MVPSGSRRQGLTHVEKAAGTEIVLIVSLALEGFLAMLPANNRERFFSINRILQNFLSPISWLQIYLFANSYLPQNPVSSCNIIAVTRGSRHRWEFGWIDRC